MNQELGSRKYGAKAPREKRMKTNVRKLTY